MIKKYLRKKERAHRAAVNPPPRQCPFNDYKNGLIFEGDTIRHPHGETAKVVYDPAGWPSAPWRAVYARGDFSSNLALQIGEKGQAVVVV